jgi:signal transduction histidine kinase
MDDHSAIAEVEARAASVAPPRRGLGLSWKLLALTVAFALVSAILIYVPRIASYRITWLTDRLAMADTAAVVLAAPDQADVPRDIQDELLKAVGATAIAIRSGNVSRLIAAVEMPPEVDAVVDLRTVEPSEDVIEAFRTLLTPEERMVRVVGNSYSGAEIELVIGDAPLRAAMLRYSAGVLWLWAAVSLILAVLLFVAVNRMFVRPIRRISHNMESFAADPQDPRRVIVPSGRGDELGVAEHHLAEMQRDLQSTLAEQRHLADLGLAVSKINHDLRNMLASAQLFSDRLGSLPDPMVQRFAPKLIAALDRAIAFTQSTLAYGRAREAPSARRLVRLDRLVDEVADSLGLVAHPAIAFENAVPEGLEVDADPDQLYRILNNLARNAVQALDGGDQNPALVRRLIIGARREAGRVVISVEDTGPGVPEKARTHLFQAFQGGARPGGTGLGLAIAAELARAHGGGIALVDRAGPGARFEVTIPDRDGQPHGRTTP